MLPSRLVSLHFPKAGGTSLVTQLQKLLPDQVALDYEHDPLVDASSLTATFPSGQRVVHGHFKPQRYAIDDVFLITFLREPVDNLISIYFYWRNLPLSTNPVHMNFLNEKPDIFSFAKYPRINTLMSKTYFENFDMRRFHFIGFHECRRKDILRLGEVIALPLLPDIHKNLSPQEVEREALRSDPRSLARLRSLLVEDLNFYEFAKRIAS